MYKIDNPNKVENKHYQTINDILIYQKNHKPDAIAYRFIVDDNNEETVTYLELYQRVFSLAAYLQKFTQPLDKVVLSANPGLDLIVGFYASLIARTIAVPIFPPANKKMAIRFLHVVGNAKPKLILCDEVIAKTMGKARVANRFIPKVLKNFWGINDIQDQILSLLTKERIKIMGINKEMTHSFNNQQKFPLVFNNDIAFLQYTSGSIGDPKGVILTHSNIIENAKIISEVLNLSPSSHMFSWLPPYHDMGMIGFILAPLYGGVTATLMSTLDFIKRPSKWVKLMSRYRCTISSAPNFAFELCALKTSDELIRTIDLSALEIIGNGSEPVSVHAMNLFYNRFKDSGLRKDVILPCYGLAESTLLVSAKQLLTKETILHVNSDALKKNIVQLVEKNDVSKAIVSSGIPRLDVKIVNPKSCIECKSFEVGEIWVSGQSVSSGYFENPITTKKTFNGIIKNDLEKKKYLCTGDLGFIYEGELYVTGRLKNLIIIDGLNYYPQDFEHTVNQSHELIRSGNVVAFGLPGVHTEHLAIVAEIQASTSENELAEIINSIKTNIFELHQIPVHIVALLPKGTVPKTTSGKLQRGKCKEEFLNTTLKTVKVWQSLYIQNNLV